MLSEKEKHPSYGMLSFAHCQHGAPTALFGSSLKHTNTVQLRLHSASVERMFNADYYLPKGLIAEVEMSPNQFAELISSANQDGTPVTIRWLKGDGPVPECPFTDKRQQFEQELSENLQNANNEINSLITKTKVLFDKKSALNKSEKEQILSNLSQLSHLINDNRASIYSQFNEQMDKTVSEAKHEIEAFVQNRMANIANQTLAEQKNSLESLINLIEIENTHDEKPETD